MKPRRPPAVKAADGFTLVELVIVIALSGVVAVLASNMVGSQMQGYIDTSRRAELVAKADAALKQMARDFRNAVPYSIRIAGNAIEWVPIQDFGRYRKNQAAGAGDVLDFSAPDTQFDVIGPMPALASNVQLVIGNTPALATGFNLYQSESDGTLLPLGAHVISPSGTAVGASGSTITLDSPFQFSQDSVAGRFYVVNGAASYLCNIGSGEINRYEGYPIQSSQPASAPGGSTGSALLVDTVSACNFGYTVLNASHGLLTINLKLTQDGETINLVRIIHVENRP